MKNLINKIVFVAEQDAIEKVEIEFFDIFQGELFRKYITIIFESEALQCCLENFAQESTYCEMNGETYWKFMGMWAHIDTDEFASIMEDFAKDNFKKVEIGA